MTLLPEPVTKFFSMAFSLLEKEEETLEELHAESKATVRRMAEEDSGLQPVLEKAHAYAVFPSVGKATAVVGGAYGKGEVFQGDQLIGYAGLVQLTIGVQVGGQTFSEIVVFQDEEALERFKAGNTRFAANASAVLVKAGAAASSNYDFGAIVFVSSEGGMMLEAAIGAQKFIFKPAALGRTKSAPPEPAPPENAPAESARSESDGPKSARPKRARPKPGKSAAAKKKTNPRRPEKAARKSKPSAAKSKARRPVGKSKAQQGGAKRSSGASSRARAGR